MSTPSDTLNQYAIIADTDWAPDFTIEYMANMFARYGVKATWFLTHDSPVIAEIKRQESLFEFGMHPNFLPNSSHGMNEREVFSFMRRLLPDTKLMRTHGLVQSSALLKMAVAEFGIEIDLSLFLPGAPYVQPHTIYYEHGGKGLLRIPCFFEDDAEMYLPGKSWDIGNPKFHPAGVKVFAFHPMYVYLNADSMTGYESLKKLGPLHHLRRDLVEPYQNTTGLGAGTLFESMCAFLSAGQSTAANISEIAAAWRKMD